MFLVFSLNTSSFYTALKLWSASGPLFSCFTFSAWLCKYHLLAMVPHLFSCLALSSELWVYIFITNLNICEKLNAKFILGCYLPQKMVPLLKSENWESFSFALFPALALSPSPVHHTMWSIPDPVSVPLFIPFVIPNHHHFPPRTLQQSSKWSFYFYSCLLLICSLHSL